MKKLAVIGASGMVASRFCDLAKSNFEITRLDEKTVDITDNAAVEKYFNENKFDSVINFAAFTNVDAAEKERDDENGITYRLNVLGPKNLAEYCNDNNIFLVHISTDFVFTGSEDEPGPYSEDAPLPETSNGMGWYGWTKNRAEVMIKNTSTDFAIVRYAYPFRAAPYELKNDWARGVIKLYEEKKLYPLFTDQIQSVVFVDELVEPLSKIVKEELTGIFHIAASDTNTPYEIGSYLLEKFAGKPAEVEKGSMAEFLKTLGHTPRPRIGGLNTKKTQKSLNLEFKTWKEMVDEFVSQIKST